MKNIKKMLVSLVSVSMVAAFVVIPVKAGTLAEDQAWVQAQALAGMVSGQAHLDEIAAQAKAGMESGQAYLDAAKATMNKDQDLLAAQALAGMTTGQAYLDAALATMNKDQASLEAQAKAGMVSGQAHLDEIAAQAKAGMVSAAVESVRVAKANLDSVKELAKVNPCFEEMIPAAEAALAKAEAELAALK